MLENLLFSLNVVLPVFIMITLGFLGVRFGVVGPGDHEQALPDHLQLVLVGEDLPEHL